MRIWNGYQNGVNLGGWLSQYATYDINHFKDFITEEDFKTIASLGFDHVRIPVDYPLLEDEEGNRNEVGYERLHFALEMCRKYHLHLLLDLHEIYGYSFDPLKKNMDREKFFYDSALQSRFHNLWKNIISEFKKDTDVMAFELLNEVVLCKVYAAWNKVAKETIETIRFVSKDADIVLGGVSYNDVNSVPYLEKPMDEHIIYNFHCYEPFAFTHQGAYWVENMDPNFRIGYPKTVEEYRKAANMFSKENSKNITNAENELISPLFFEKIFQPAILHAEKYNVPLYCGEYGVIDNAPVEDTLRWFRDIHAAFQHYHIGHAIWNYKEKDFGISGKHYEAIFHDILKTPCDNPR